MSNARRHFLLTCLCLLPAAVQAQSNHPVVELKTNHGLITVELYEDKAPVSVKNFLSYVDDGFYDGTVFHRVIDGFMIQGGGLSTTMEKKATKAGIKNEATNGLKNTRGTLAMARTPVIDSATAQFFINVADNDFLNHRDVSQSGYGYAVFGKVIAGMDVVDKIKAVRTGSCGAEAPRDCPVAPVIIENAQRKPAAPAPAPAKK
ncbi:MAG: peptidylprolyl isomerase [Myxococcota bacterium]